MILLNEIVEVLITPHLDVLPTAGEMTTVVGATRGGNERILLVEDDAMVRDQIVRQLEFLGYSIATALDGHDALRLIKGRDTFDLMITDVMMPGGINGWQLGQTIRNIRPSMPVLFISGFSDDAAEKDRRAVSDFLLLRKPFGQRIGRKHPPCIGNQGGGHMTAWRSSKEICRQTFAEFLPTYRA